MKLPRLLDFADPGDCALFLPLTRALNLTEFSQTACEFAEEAEIRPDGQGYLGLMRGRNGWTNIGRMGNPSGPEDEWAFVLPATGPWILLEAVSLAAPQ
jgi:hypothetical protein